MAKKDILASSKKIRRKRYFLKFLISFFFLLSLVFIFSGLSHLQYFRVNNISVHGDYTIDNEDIISNISDSISARRYFLFPEDNIFVVPKEKIISGLLAGFSRIKSASLARNFPSTLEVYISERKPSSLSCEERDCFFIDQEGFVFEKSPFFSGSIYTVFRDKRDGIRGRGEFFQILPKEDFGKIMDFLKSLDDEGIKMAEVILKKEGSYEFYTIEGWYIIASKSNNFKNVFNNLKTALEEEIKEERSDLEYMDMRLEDKIFYKYKD